MHVFLNVLLALFSLDIMTALEVADTALWFGCQLRCEK